MFTNIQENSSSFWRKVPRLKQSKETYFFHFYSVHESSNWLSKFLLEVNNTVSPKFSCRQHSRNLSSKKNILSIFKNKTCLPLQQSLDCAMKLSAEKMGKCRHTEEQVPSVTGNEKNCGLRRVGKIRPTFVLMVHIVERKITIERSLRFQIEVANDPECFVCQGGLQQKKLRYS